MRAEVTDFDVADADLGTGRVVVRRKGDKRRAVFVTNGALDALRACVAARGPQPDALLIATFPSATSELSRAHALATAASPWASPRDHNDTPAADVTVVAGRDSTAA